MPSARGEARRRPARAPLARAAALAGALMLAALLLVAPRHIDIARPAALTPDQDTYEGAMATLASLKRAGARERRRREERGRRERGQCDLEAHVAAERWWWSGGRPGAGAEGEKTMVFLLAHGRSGSTLATTFFFSTADVFYLDEPLRAGFPGVSGLDAVDKAAQLLGSCALEQQTDGMPAGAPRINETEFVLFERSRYVVGNGRAPAWMAPDADAGVRGEHGGAAVLSRMAAHCARSTVVGLKSIDLLRGQHRSCDSQLRKRGQVRDVSNLDYLLTKYPTARVVHLVRHPHEVMGSRASLRWGDRDAGRSCSASAADHAVGSGHPRYTHVRYQDLLTEPVETVERVHRFMGVEPDRARIRATVREHILLPGGAGAGAANRYDTRRERMRCAPCGAAVDAELPPVCLGLVGDLGLLCCSAASGGR